MKSSMVCQLGAAVLVLAGLGVWAQPPAQIDYQGKILVNDIPLTGAGYFKYAISDEAATTNFWAHDGTGTGEPTTYITNDCYNGVFSAALGAAPMGAIDPDVFSIDTSLYLRVWFSSDAVTFDEMLPAQRFLSAPYAINADLLDGLHAADIIALSTNGYSEVDPVFSASAAFGVTSGGIANWNTAHGWGNHALAGYLTSYTETDPIWSAASTGYYQRTESDARYVEVTGDTMTGALAIDDIASGTLKLDSSQTNIALGSAASAMGGTERIAIGHNVTNVMDNTARLRGEVYMDGGMAVYGRSPFGAGPFQQLLPLPPLDNVVYVATNGTLAGPGTVDRPFDQPQRAYGYAATHYSNTPATVVIAAGQYPALDMNAGNIHVIGESRAQLDSLTISAAAHSILGKQRVENLIAMGRVIVAAELGQDVKFHNCRFESGLSIFGSNVEVQDCFVSGMEGSAVTVGDGINTISDVALTQSSFWSTSVSQGTLYVNAGVESFEVIGCKIFNMLPYAAIEDLQFFVPGLLPHFYSHNVIRGAEHGMPIPAVYDPMAAPGPTLVFLHNAVWGDVGVTSNQQFYANNIVYGEINNTGGPIGWSQAGAGVGIDSAGNTEHQFVYPQAGVFGFPWAWRD
ncbi:MAG: hypothetical protein RBT03_10395 [Kiritimatiellia bacterium]|jgi:hypothetical protein|nr:hypothetical protein [Kiritimatiellia bacterium]